MSDGMVPNAWLDEVADAVNGLMCDGIRAGGECTGHHDAYPPGLPARLYEMGRCEASHRVIRRIAGLRAGVNRPEDRDVNGG